MNYRISIISLLFLGIDSQPWLRFVYFDGAEIRNTTITTTRGGLNFVNSFITKLTFSLTSYFLKFLFKINGLNYLLLNFCKRLFLLWLIKFDIDKLAKYDQ